jgi:hypothetical protein
LEGVSPSRAVFKPAARQEPRENDKFFLNASRTPMPFRLLGASIILGALTGFANFSEGAFFRTLGGQILQGMLSMACLILVGVAFCRFGWKMGLLDLLLVIIGAHLGLALHRRRLP